VSIAGGYILSVELSRVVRTLREKRGITQVVLARNAKIAQPYLTQIEQGKRKNPSLDVLKRLAKALGVPVTELLE
jgi:transcriptional regulator with XRE-family HTH domain